MENPEKAAAVLEQLSAAGAGLSLDDFGTGYSSLSYLTQFSFDTIKVDRAFVQARTQNGTGAVVLRSIIALAHELGKKVVAEGVEAEDDVGFLRSIGCEYAQGFYYGEPMAERDLLQLLKVVRRAERRLRRSTLFRQRVKTPDAEPVVVAAAVPAPVEVTNGRRPPPARRGPMPLNGPQTHAAPPTRPMNPVPANGLSGSERMPPGGPPPLPRTGPPTAPPANDPNAVRLNLPPTPLRPAPVAPPPQPNGGAMPGQPPPRPQPPPLPGGARPPPAGAQRPNLPPPPRPSGRPPPDFSKLPPAIRASLARLAGEIAEEEVRPPPPEPPGKG
jgi:hypothetical protein